MLNENFVLPKEFLEKMKEQLGDDYQKFFDSYNEQAVRGLRVNTNKISTEDFEKYTNLKVKKLSFSNDGYLLCQDDKIGNTVEHLAGLFYLQEPSSMTPVVASGIINDDRPLKILDLCASPGGKTGQIASRVKEDSIIFSNEIVKSRADVLFSNIERLGFRNVVVLNEPPKNLEKFENYFDYVFVDAPCSGEGMFRKNPETISEWSLQNVSLCENRQREILSIAQKLVAPNGKLIYSTCTFSMEEDENIVDWFTNNYNFKIIDVPNEIIAVTKSSRAKSENAKMARKFLPYYGDGEGQFLCVFQREDCVEIDKLYSKKHFRTINLVSKINFEALCEFTNRNMDINFSRNRVFEMGDNLFYVPSQFDSKLQTALDDLKLITIGVKLGQVEKHIFKPNHSIFMSFSKNFVQNIELSEIELKKYLHGEELMYNSDKINSGYVAILNKGYVVGGAKVSSNKLKNLYPKGLRI